MALTLRVKELFLYMEADLRVLRHVGNIKKVPLF